MQCTVDTVSVFTDIVMAKLFKLPRRILMGLIQCYRYCISPLIAGRCRFYPTCSAYSLEALDRHGFLKGSWLTVKRLLRCHPWHPGGIDLVPESPEIYQIKPDNHTYQPPSVARKSWICKEHS